MPYVFYVGLPLFSIDLLLIETSLVYALWCMVPYDFLEWASDYLGKVKRIYAIS